MLRVSISILGFLVLPALAAAGEIRVIFWFDRSRPLDTFKFQAYDLRKHEFTPDVERWLSATKAKFPNYDVYTREVDLSRERGETDKLKIGSAIIREFLVVGDRHGYTFGPYTGPSSGPPIGTPPLRPLPQPGSSRFDPGTSPSWSPFPVPFPRPHP